MNKAFQLIFWGVFFTSFTVNIGKFEILPAFIAFLILRAGLKLVLEVMPDEDFQWAKRFCNLNVGISAVLFVLNFFTQGSVLYFISAALLSVNFLIQIGLYFCILSGSSAFFSTHGTNELPPKPMYSWPDSASSEMRKPPEKLSTGEALARRYSLKTNIFTVCLTIVIIWILWNYFFLNSEKMMPIVIFILLKIWLLVQLGNIRSQATDLEDPLLIGGLQGDTEERNMTDDKK